MSRDLIFKNPSPAEYRAIHEALASHIKHANNLGNMSDCQRAMIHMDDDENHTRQIKALLDEAVLACDTVQVLICRRALDGNVAARAKCGRVILARAVADLATTDGG